MKTMSRFLWWSIILLELALTPDAMAQRYFHGKSRFDEIIGGIVSETEIFDATDIFPDNRLEPILNFLYDLIPELSDIPGLSGNYQLLGDGSSTVFEWRNPTIGRWPVVRVREANYPYRDVLVSTQNPADGILQFRFSSPPAANQYMAYAVPADAIGDTTTITHDLDTYNLTYAVWDTVSGIQQLAAGYTASATQFTVPALGANGVVAVAALNNEQVLTGDQAEYLIQHFKNSRNVFPMLRRTVILPGETIHFYPLNSYQYASKNSFTLRTSSPLESALYTIAWMVQNTESVNYFYRHLVGDTGLIAEYSTDTLEYLAGNGIELSADEEADQITIATLARLTTAAPYVWSVTQPNYLGSPLNTASLDPGAWTTVWDLGTDEALLVKPGSGAALLTGGGYNGLISEATRAVVFGFLEAVLGAGPSTITADAVNTTLAYNSGIHDFQIGDVSKVQIGDTQTSIENALHINGGASFDGHAGQTTGAFSILTNLKVEGGQIYIKSVTAEFTDGGLTAFGAISDWTLAEGQ